MHPRYRIPALLLLCLNIGCASVKAQEPWDPQRDERMFSYVFPHPGHYINDHCLIRADSLWHLYFIDGTPEGRSTRNDLGDNGFNRPGIPADGAQTGIPRWDRPGNEVRIGHATSPDLITWTPHDSVIGIGADSAFDRAHVYAPNVIERNGTYYMIYTGNAVSFSDGEHLFLATSTDLYNWSRYRPEPIFRPDTSWAVYRPIGYKGGPGGPVSGRDPHLHHDPRYGYILYYVGLRRSDDATVPDGTYAAVAAATSPDLINWTDRGPLLTRKTRVTGDGFSWHHPESPSLVLRNNVYYLFWKGGNGTRYVMGTDPLDFSNAEEHRLATSHASEIFEWEGDWYVTSCSRDVSDVYHGASDRTRGLFLAQLRWKDSIPEVIPLDVALAVRVPEKIGTIGTARIWPNPVRSGEMVSVRLAEGSGRGEYDVSVLDIRSSEVLALSLTTFIDQDGARAVEVPTVGLAAGVYFVRIGATVARLIVI